MNFTNSHTEEVIAFDGKRMRGSYDLQDRKSALHMVSAYASEQRLCPGQLATEEKSNEITAITIDAMDCQIRYLQENSRQTSR